MSLTVIVPTDFGKRTGRRVKVAVTNIAVPTPSVILSRMQKRMNTQPEGNMSTNLVQSVFGMVNHLPSRV